MALDILYCGYSAQLTPIWAWIGAFAFASAALTVPCLPASLHRPLARTPPLGFGLPAPSPATWFACNQHGYPWTPLGSYVDSCCIATFIWTLCNLIASRFHYALQQLILVGLWQQPQRTVLYVSGLPLMD